MKKTKIGIFLLGALAFSANTFAATISGQEQELRASIKKCISDIELSKRLDNDGSGLKSILYVIYDEVGGAHKSCSSDADKTRSLITPAHDQQEKWEEKFQSLHAAYSSIPKEKLNGTYALYLINKIRELNAPDKLDSRHPQSKLYVYRAMMQELDKLDALLPTIEGQ